MSIARLSTEYLRKKNPPPAKLAGGDLGVVTVTDPTEPDVHSSAVQNALTVLTKYIPTEIVTIYVPVFSMLVLNELVDGFVVYWSFAVATPMVLLLVYQAQRRANELPLATFRELPLWRMFAALIAFCVWARAVPGLPVTDAAKATIIASVLALIVSTLLNLIEPIVEK